MLSIADDAVDCAGYILRMRKEHANWERFDLGIDDFLMRHHGEASTLKLRQILADAYQGKAPDDEEAFNRILQN